MLVPNSVPDSEEKEARDDLRDGARREDDRNKAAQAQIRSETSGLPGMRNFSKTVMDDAANFVASKVDRVSDIFGFGVDSSLHVGREIEQQMRGLNVGELGREDEEVTRSEYWIYRMEKYMNSTNFALYKLLGMVLAIMVVLLGTLWYAQQQWDDPVSFNDLWADWRRLRSGGGGETSDVSIAAEADSEEETSEISVQYTWLYCIFIAFQVILTAGIDDSIDGLIWVPTYMLMVLVGLLVLGILIGMLTEGFTSLVDSIRQGNLKAVEKDHTLILGWSEGTVRLVCQLAFLRRQYQQMNESWACYFMPWRRKKPATPVAAGSIVIMCNTKSKEEMEQLIEQGFGERGIMRQRTRLGYDVVCRRGDPSNIQDLQRVGAHRARAIVLKLAKDDRAPEGDGSDPVVASGVTMRTLMALRFVLFTAKQHPPWTDERAGFGLRVVVESNQECPLIEAASFTSPVNGEKIVFSQDLSKFLNSLVFSCVGQPGLAQVQMELMSFDGAAVKFRKASEFSNMSLVGKSVREAAGTWEDAVLLGVRSAKKKAAGADCSGILPKPTYVIQADDEIIFLCEASIPRPAKASGLTCEPVDLSNFACERRPESAAELPVLICGWRSDWNSEATLLAMMHQVATTARQDTLLHFLNAKQADEFQDIMKALEADVRISTTMSPDQPKPGESFVTLRANAAGSQSCRIRIAHTCGNAYEFPLLKQVLKERHYKEAIVIPPEAKARDMVAADTCIMSIILMIRQTQRDLDRPPLHIVAENSRDSTSKLAMVPVEHTDDGIVPHVPDFVNTLAIKARALCQVLAFPQMGDILDELFTMKPGSATLVMVFADAYGLDGKTVSYLQVKQHVRRLQPDASEEAGEEASEADDVCLGFQKDDGVMYMPPASQTEEHTFKKRDRLIILTRKKTTSHSYEIAVRDRVRGLLQPVGAGSATEVRSEMANIEDC